MSSNRGPAAVTRVLATFTVLPFHNLAQGSNRSMRSVLAEITGLSKARIAQGNLDAMRPSTKKKVDAHLRGWLEKKLDDPRAVASVLEKCSTAPHTRSGGHALWAQWIHALEFPPALLLPISKAVALEVDELLEALTDACQANDLSGFKRTWCAYVERHDLRMGSSDESARLHAPYADGDALESIDCWEGAQKLAKEAVDYLYLDIIAALDAEWSCSYFGGRQTAPLFPLVMMRLQDGLLETKKAISRKNVFYRPARRLLETLYALLFLKRYRKWPEKPPGPKDLAMALDDPTNDDAITAAVISNHFDGTLKLTLELTYDYWCQLYAHFFPGTNEGERAAPPDPMIMLALQWDAIQIQDSGRTLFLFDLDAYVDLWRERRQQWDELQATLYEHRPETGHSEQEPIEWPAWMANQWSSPSLTT